MKYVSTLLPCRVCGNDQFDVGNTIDMVACTKCGVVYLVGDYVKEPVGLVKYK